MNEHKPDSTTPTFSMIKVYYKKGIPKEEQQKQIIEAIQEQMESQGMKVTVREVDVEATINKNS